jgi:hypothetical protein
MITLSCGLAGFNRLDAQLSDSGKSAYHDALKNYTSPELRARLELLRSVQQRGYAEVLSETMRRDGILAFIALLKLRLQVEFSLPHTPILTDVTSPDVLRYHEERMRRMTAEGRTPGPGELEPSHTYMYLTIDWSFPADPWERRK